MVKEASTSVERAIAERAEAEIFSGDATDHGLNLHESSILRRLGQELPLAEHCPVQMLQVSFALQRSVRLQPSMFRTGGPSDLH